MKFFAYDFDSVIESSQFTKGKCNSLLTHMERANVSLKNYVFVEKLFSLTSNGLLHTCGVQ